MLPVPGLSTPTVAAPFIAPRNRVRESMVDYSSGGIGLNNSTRGLNFQTWVFTYNELARQIYTTPEATGVPRLVHQLPGSDQAIEIAGSFDTNMQPVTGWRNKQNFAFFRWFDPVPAQFVVVPLAAGSRNVRIVLDDVRPGQTGTGATDTMISYVRSGSLYMRQLRDRFNIEYLLKSGIDGYRLGQFGMNRRWRLQWEIY